MDRIKKHYITEFIGLDLLRFILSTVVVFRHYYHFYFPYPDSPYVHQDTIITEQPFFDYIWPLYDWGNYAVQVFWIISGLIFYSVYNKELSAKALSFGEYSFLRFTRLYPLHFASLIFVTIAQLIYLQSHGTFFVYQNNTVSNFFLQLLFIGAWVPDFHHSFNTPVWSVSIEIFTYLVFYLLTYAGLTKGRKLIWLIGVLVVFEFYGILPLFGYCMLYFFSGCLVARYIEEGVSLNRLLIISIVVSVVLAVLVKVIRPFLPLEMVQGFFFTLRKIPIAITFILLFIVLFYKMKSPGIIKLFKNLGNMTYSTYMVHFPLQIVIFLILEPVSYTYFNNPLVLFMFVAISVSAGWIAYQYFEKPIQKYLRQRYSAKQREMPVVLNVEEKERRSATN